MANKFKTKVVSYLRKPNSFGSCIFIKEFFADTVEESKKLGVAFANKQLEDNNISHNTVYVYGELLHVTEEFDI